MRTESELDLEQYNQVEHTCCWYYRWHCTVYSWGVDHIRHYRWISLIPSVHTASVTWGVSHEHKCTLLHLFSSGIIQQSINFSQNDEWTSVCVYEFKQERPSVGETVWNSSQSKWHLDPSDSRAAVEWLWRRQMRPFVYEHRKKCVLIAHQMKPVMRFPDNRRNPNVESENNEERHLAIARLRQSSARRWFHS